MPLAITRLREMNADLLSTDLNENDVVDKNYVRISNDRGDTIDLDAVSERCAYTLALSLISNATNFTVIDTKKGG